MTKRELFKEYQALLDTRGLYRITGIDSNTNKSTLISAIKMLKLEDSEITRMLHALTAVLPNVVNTILNVDYINSGWHRQYIYDTYNLFKSSLQ